MNSTEINQLVTLLGNQGLGFFALYILYHYAGQLMGAILLLAIVKNIVKLIDNWINKYLEIRKHEHLGKNPKCNLCKE